MLSEKEFYKNIAEQAVDHLLTAYFHINCANGMWDDQADREADEKAMDLIDELSVNVLDAILHGEDAYAAYCEDESERE